MEAPARREGMVLVVSLDPQSVGACLRNEGRRRFPESGETVSRIDHRGLGLENLPRHYIKWHGVCHPPPNPPPRDKPEAGKEGEAMLPSPPPEKDQYCLVRLPPYYKVQWNLEHPKRDPKFQESQYNNSWSWTEKIMVCFN